MVQPNHSFQKLISDGFIGNRGPLVLKSVKKGSNAEREHVIEIVVDLILPACGLRLRDKFEWDISNPDNSAEEFALVLLSELSVAEMENVQALANLIKS